MRDDLSVCAGVDQFRLIVVCVCSVPAARCVRGFGGACLVGVRGVLVDVRSGGRGVRWTWRPLVVMPYGGVLADMESFGRGVRCGRT